MFVAANLFDSWVFLLLVAIAALLRWLGTKATTATRRDDFPKESPPSPEPPPRETPSSDEEQIRKFLEALGQPRTAKPPPPLQPRTDIPPRPVAPVIPPRSFKPVLTSRSAKSSTEPRKTFEPPRQEEAYEPPQPKFVYEPSPQPALAPESTVFEVRETAVPLVEKDRTRKVSARTTTQPGAALESQPIDLIQLLRSPTGLRQAIILREIFGVPRGLQRFEDLPGTA